MEFGPMGVINTVIATCVGLVLLGGVAMTYQYRAIDRVAEKRAVEAALKDMAAARASLPKFDEKRYKGLVYRP